MATPTSLPEWVEFLSHAEIPVLRHTAREINRIRGLGDDLSVRDVFSAVIDDPMLIFRLLRYLQMRKHKSQLQDIVQIEQAVMMIGMEAFFRDLPPQPLAEDMLKNNIPALTHLLRFVHRAHRAANYSLDWAVRLYDLHAEEVRVATLLHDLAECLMWCFQPEKMLDIFHRQEADRTLRSHVVQQEVLGFKLIDLQRQLIEACGLPPLLLKLIQDDAAKEQRVRNVTLAVNLARHSAHGWDDAALPDDYHDIADLLRMDVSKVKHIVGAPA